MASLRDEVEALKRRLADAMAERARLRRALIPGELVHPRSALKLTPSQRFVLGCLLHRGPWTREGLADVLRLHRHEAGEDDDEKLVSPRLVDVAVCKIRAATRPYGLNIDSVWGKGFNVVPSQRRAFRELLEAEAAQLDEDERGRTQPRPVIPAADVRPEARA